MLESCSAHLDLACFFKLPQITLEDGFARLHIQVVSIHQGPIITGITDDWTTQTAKELRVKPVLEATVDKKRPAPWPSISLGECSSLNISGITMTTGSTVDR